MILCCGEALIDMIPARSADGQKAYVPRPGGAALNTALALARPGMRAGLLAGISKDQFGRMLMAALDEAGVDTRFLVRSGRPTALAFVAMQGDEASFSFHDENSAGRLLTPEDMPDLPSGVHALLFGGISLCHEPAAEAFEALASRQAGRRLLMLDPNIRPALVADEARYRARLSRMIARADIVKLSLPDLDWLVPGSEPAQDRARSVLSHGPALVLLSLGARGAVALHGWLPDVTVAVEPVSAPDTVGAGDAFNAGVLMQLARAGALQRAELDALDEDALRRVVEAGATTATGMLRARS